ncbi:MAG: ABC transporter ATP-binding protein [Cellulosilyticaceae bacterium]
MLEHFSAEKAVEMKNITKKFGDFTANNNISLTVHKGEVHALLGENGAGKTTLMNILYGLYTPTSGEIFINGQKVEINSPNNAIQYGIGMVHQHFMLVEPFTITENIILGIEDTNFLGMINMKEAVKEIEELSHKYGLLVEPMEKIQDVSVGIQQRVEILKALYRDADILILDEPTAVLTPSEVQDLIHIIKALTNEGKSIIIITHKLKEIKQVADYCTIIRKGEQINTVKVSDVTENQLAEMMVGREVNFKVDKAYQKAGKTILEVDNLKVKNNRKLYAINELNLEVKAGEILGIAGVDGNGQSELVDALTGVVKVSEGTIKLNNKDITNWPPNKIRQMGQAVIPQDRQKRGLVLDFTVEQNAVLEKIDKEPFSRKGIINYPKIKEYAKELIQKFDIRPPDETLPARSLSGGNQQKIIIAREVTNNPDLLIAAQPTRGLDVGAIEYVHKSLVSQRNDGKAVLLISLELDEVLGLSDRIAVIYEGKIVGIVDARHTNEKELGYMMAGGEPH